METRAKLRGRDGAGGGGAMTERAKRCGNCGAWDADHPMLSPGDMGDCRRARPAVVSMMRGEEMRGRWPRVHADDWCLDWVPREAGDGGE